MNLLLLRAYPRKNGYTHKLTELFVQGIKEAGVTPVERDVASLDIHPCIGCYKCWVATPGVCCFKDDMVALKEDILKADVIICATPLNSFSVSSSLKAVFDRTLSLTKPEFEETSLGTVRNKLRFP
jgi:multimeric flavodoxin WrbA